MTPRDFEPGDADVAILGTAARLPGARNVEEFWDNLRCGRESIVRYTDEELAEAGAPEELVQLPQYVKAGAPLDQMEWFDANFFGFSPKDAAVMDPQHRQMLECAWEALESATIVPSRFDGAVGVFVGSGHHAYFAYNLLSQRDLMKDVGLFLIRHTGNDKDFLATRISYCLDLKGPSINVQTACSTSLVAVHLACQSLLAGECDVALAGGVTLEIPHRQGYLYKPNEILSPDGRCRAFDARSDGTVFGSGVGAVVLRPLEDAIAAGDPIQAVLRATAVNNDGAGKVGYLAPSVDGHADVVEEALALARFDADTIDYVEAHGTGTRVGDPIEVSALTQAFRRTSTARQTTALGSVKTNIGHLDTAAGVAGLIKVVESLRHRQMPPSLGFESANPLIDFESSPFFVNSELRSWERRDHPRRAGVSALGVGGTNAHAVVEEWVQGDDVREAREWQVLLASGKSRRSAEDNLAAYAERCTDRPLAELADAAFTTQVGREALTYRKALVVRDGESIPGDGALPVHKAPETVRGTAFLFPGGGAQYAGMGRDLYETEPAYRRSLDECFDLLRDRHGIDLAPWVLAERDDEEAHRRLHSPDLSVLSVFCVEYALARHLQTCGVQPAAMIGHSLGEYAAACIAGVFSLEDALRLVALRGALFARLPPGGMLSVQLSEDDLGRALRECGLGDAIDVAAVNAPSLTVASGAIEDLSRLEQWLAEQEIESRRLRIDVAAHSKALDPVLDEFREGLEAIVYRAPEIRFVSNLTGRWITADEATSPDYWLRHLRSTVRFGDGIQALLGEDLVLLEAGPGNALGTLARLSPEADAGLAVVAALRRSEEPVHDRARLLGALGQLWTFGASVDWSASHTHERRRVQLPGYSFDRQRYWIERVETAVTEASGLRRRALGEGWMTTPAWEDASPLEDLEPETRQTWLVFVDLLGTGDRVADLLEDSGHEVVRVQEGDAFHRESAKRYRLPPELGQTSYDELVAQLEGDSLLPTHVLHAWSLTRGDAHRRASNLFHQHQERGFASLLRLMKALGAELGTRVEEIRVVANDLLAVGERMPGAPGKATLLGPLKVSAQENPGLRTQCLHVDAESEDISQLARRVASELSAPPRHQILALDGAKRFAQVLKPFALDAATAGQRFKSGRTVLITGGLGDLALELAGTFADSKARIVLMTRSPFPDRSAWAEWQRSHDPEDPTARRIARIEALEASGCRIEVLRADVTDIEAVQAAVATVRRRFGNVHGVLHAAGVTDDRPILQKSPDSIDRVLGPKLLGTMILADALLTEPLDFFVAFGSTSAWLAPAGQVDYTAAACFLGSWAAAHPRRPAVSTVHWGAWADAGLARRAVERLRGGATRPLESKRVEHPVFHALRLLPRGERPKASTELPGATVSTRAACQLRGTLSTRLWMLDEHRVLDGRAILPGTGHVELLLSAMALYDDQPYELLDLVFVAPLWMRSEEEREIEVRITPTKDDVELELRTRSASGGVWTLHSQATAKVLQDVAPSPVDPARLSEGLESASALTLDAAGDQAKAFDFGPRWQVLRRARFGSDAIAEVALDSEYHDDFDSYLAHPALLDVATGFALRLAKDFDAGRERLVPLTYERLRLFERLPPRFLSRVRLATRQEDGTVRFDIWLVARDGAVLGEIQGLAFRRIRKEALFQEAPHPVATHEAPSLTAGERLFLRTVEQGITADEGRDVLRRLLTSEMPAEVFVSPFDLDALARRAAEAEAEEESAKFERPELESEFQEPSTTTERELAALFEDLLGVERVGIDDDFFALGGHSLVAVRLFARIKKQFGEEFPLSLLFEAPTVRLLAQRLRSEAAQEEPRDARNEGFRYVVPLHRVDSTTKRPFFIVSGMLGNVLNLRYLARRLGEDQQVYALQARGLYGEAEPHDRFEDMAVSYLEEVRSIQPQGPYFLGGFSGGGLIALEMARLLESEGEETGMLAMLDTPAKIDGPNWRDRLELQLIKWRRSGPLYPLDFLKQRLSWEQAKLRERRTHPDLERSPAIFRSAQIEQAFLTALDRYEPRYYSGTIHLFRPELDRAFALSGQRTMNSARCFVRDDNHWRDLVDHVDVTVVAGEHNSMVLEPHVRILANRLRAKLEQQPGLYVHAERDAQKTPV